MKAIVQDTYGSPATLRVEEVDPPAPAEGEVLVHVHAASVNARDWHLMRGDPYVARLMDPTMFGRRGPQVRIRGTDFAGRVTAVGPGVTGIDVGDEVYGEADGTFAEQVCAPASKMERKPANLTFEQAAAVPLAAVTALQGLREQARIHTGQRLLVNGASGGVSTFAVQLAVAFGAEVTAVCSTRNRELVASLGADHVIDYTRRDFTRDDRRYDVVFDLVGNRSLTALRRVLTPAGTLLLAGGGVSRGGSLIGPVGLIVRGMVVGRLVRQRLLLVDGTPTARRLADLRELIEAGKITPVIDRTYPLTEAPEAIRYMEEEHARAKVVVTV